MEPLLNSNKIEKNNSPELSDVNPEINKQSKNEYAIGNESDPSLKIESINQQVENALSINDNSVAIPGSLPTVKDENITPTSVQSTGFPTPQVAEDIDIIEKEWVRAAEKIIQDTENNPHERDNQVSGLRKEYKNKRYPNSKPKSN